MFYDKIVPLVLSSFPSFIEAIPPILEEAEFLLSNPNYWKLGYSEGVIDSP